MSYGFVSTVIFQWSVSVLIVTLIIVFHMQAEKKVWLYELILLILTIRNLIPLIDLANYEHKLKFQQETDHQIWMTKTFFPMTSYFGMYIFSFSILLTLRHKLTGVIISYAFQFLANFGYILLTSYPGKDKEYNIKTVIIMMIQLSICSSFLLLWLQTFFNASLHE